jgi:hypothetical protein
MDTNKASSKKINREMVIKALTDPKFRRALTADPAAALGKKRLTEVQMKEVRLVLAAVKGIDKQIGSLADELLCANGGGGCSIG